MAFSLRNCQQEFISKVIAEYLTDSDDLDEATTVTAPLLQDLKARVLLECDIAD